MSNPYPTHVTVCDGKYTVIYDFDTGQSECLHYGEPWRDLCGDKMVLALFDTIVELRETLRQADKLCVEALPKFNWAASPLDANAIKLLNEVPREIQRVLERE